MPWLCLITGGTSASVEDFAHLLKFVEAAVTARVTFVQLREKALSPRMLYQLTQRAAALTRGSATRLLVNDRADIARTAGADGVHLTTHSLHAATVRQALGPEFIIGVSTHTLAEARAAHAGGADFATFGPVFATPSKRAYGPPVGLEKLAEAARALPAFPLLALGGVTLENAPQVFATGAAGLAAIRLFADAGTLAQTAAAIRIHDLRSYE
jgi:thiamine-phosphate pyrophosphorylase